MPRKSKYNKASMSKSEMECYQELATAVIRQSIEDYEVELDHTASDGVKTEEQRILERFFLSDWGQTLSMNNGEMIIKTVKERFMQNLTA